MAKKTQMEYVEIINQKKHECQAMGWVWFELNAKELNEEIEPKTSNVTAVCKAMLETMLEGDHFIVEPKIKTKVSGALRVRYYVDNLSAERRTYAEANA